MIRILKHVIPEWLKLYVRAKAGAPDQESSLRRLKQIGYSHSVILDIGAYEGKWCTLIKSIYPDSSVLMLEGQEAKAPILKKTSSLHQNTDFIIALLGATNQEVDFNIYDTASSVLKEDNFTGANVEKRMLSTLDQVVKDTPFERPNFIKIDTQGYELEILKGGRSTLKSADVVLMEVSLIDIYKECPLVHDVTSFMKNEGFVLYDICSLMRRPYDSALFQADFLFVREDSSLRVSKRWN